MKQTDKCRSCKHELQYHAGECAICKKEAEMLRESGREDWEGTRCLNFVPIFPPKLKRNRK